MTWIALALLGCGRLVAPPQPLQASPIQIQQVVFSHDNGHVTAALTIGNPSRTDTTIDDVMGAILIADQTLGEFRVTPEKMIPAGEDATILLTVPGAIPLDTQALRLRGALHLAGEPIWISFAKMGDVLP